MQDGSGLGKSQLHQDHSEQRLYKCALLIRLANSILTMYSIESSYMVSLPMVFNALLPIPLCQCEGPLYDRSVQLLLV